MCRILDSWELARQMHPGQRNSLDALCRRYSVDNSHRDHHGALLDARLLAEVYLAMTGGQAKFELGADVDPVRIKARAGASRPMESLAIVVVRASDEEMIVHEHLLALLDKASAGKTVWRTL
jgi:DNA polymerase-3 subunit epsilon